MSNPEIDQAENKLSDAIKNLRTQKEPDVEVVPEVNNDIEVVIDSPKPEIKEPRRSEFVKTDDPKVLERINDLYGQVKKSDARNQMIIEHNKQLEQRLSEYVEKVSTLERTTKDAATNKVETELKQALRTAREENDFDRMDEIDGKLQVLRDERIKSTLIPQEKVALKVHPQQQQYEQQLVHNATYIEYLSQEKDGVGNPIRPYLNDWHPDNQKAVELFSSIPKEFAAAGKQADLKTVMEVLDERIRGKKQAHQASVLGGDNNDAPARNVVKLTSQEVEIAKKMGIKPEAYAKQKQLLMS